MEDKIEEFYIDHEVRIRVSEELLRRVDSKLNLLIGLLIGSVVIPIVLHTFSLT